MREQKQNTTDQGWVAMQRILDREMPQRRRRRIVGWWWFGGLFLLCAFVVAGWQISQRADSTAPVAPALILPAAPLAERTAPAALPPVHATSEASTNTGQDAAFMERTKVEKRNYGQTYPLPSQSFSVKKADSALEKAPQMLPPNTAISASETPVQAELAAPTNNIAGDALAVLPTIPPALEMEIKPGDFAKYPDYTTDLTKIIRHRASWEFGLMAGINSERLPRINGGTLGLVADWQPFRHWGLRSGVQYTMQRLAADESLVTAISQDAYEKSSTGLGLLDGSGNYAYLGTYSSINTDILAAVRRIHRIEAPLLVYWQPGRFRVYTGAVLNYTFLAQTSPRIFADNQVYKVATGRDELNRLATEKLNRWQVKWQLGVGYRLGRRVELGAGIQAALPKISLRKDSHIDADLQVAAAQNRISIEEVRQLGVSLRGVWFF